MSDEELSQRERRRLLSAALVVSIVTILVGLATVGGATGAGGGESTGVQTTTLPEPYNDSTPTVGNESWMQGNEEPTLNNVILMFTRVGTFVIGSGGGALGAALMGLVVFGVVVSMVGGSAPGLVGGAVLGTATIAALSIAGFAAPWTWAVTIFAIGIVLTTVMIRALQ